MPAIWNGKSFTVSVYELLREVDCNKNNFDEFDWFNFEKNNSVVLIREYFDICNKTVGQLLQNNMTKNARKN